MLGALLVSALAVGSAAAKGRKHDPVHNDAYDYVIVGGGVAGLVMANRLSEDCNTTVLVVERGYFSDKPEAMVPWHAHGMDTSVMIRPQSAPDPELNGTTSAVAVAAVVGGGSVVNGMGYGRGSKADYDAWEALGNPGWGWDGLLPYFRKSTTFIPPSPEAAGRWNITWDAGAYGDGPLHTHIPDFQYPDIAVFWEALRQQAGLDVPPGANNGAGPGAFWMPMTIDARTMTRATSRSAYYDPVNATRPNLHLLTGQAATEILFRKGKPLRARGVRIVSRADGTVRHVYAKKEVILSAGAIQTPQLLQASGIGPAAVLKAAGVKVRKHLPAVGANLQDHPTTLLLFHLGNQSFPNPDTIANNATYNATAWDEYLANRTGPISTANSNLAGYYSLPQVLADTASDPAALAARLLAQDAADHLPPAYRASPALLRGYLAQRALLAASFTSNASAITTTPFRGNGMSPRPLLKPLSRGTVTLGPNTTGPGSSNSSTEHGHGIHLPVVRYHTLQNPLDAELVLAVVRHARAFWTTSPALAALQPSELAPGAALQTDAELLGRLRGDRGIFWPSLAHPCGTCAMMPAEKGGCVDAQLRVYGVGGLRVVDASVMPLIVGTALQASVYAIAEKAADLVRGVAGS